jgi:hypothetical protein
VSVDDSAANLDLAAPSVRDTDVGADAGPDVTEPSLELPGGEPEQDGDVWGV